MVWMVKPIKQVKRTYRVSFYNEGKVFELYVRNVSSSNLFGFVELEDIIFGEKSKILIDPGEESLRTEFANTKRSFIPMHSLIRIDEMQKEVDPKPRVLPLESKEGSKVQKKYKPGPQLSPIYTPPNLFPKK